MYKPNNCYGGRCGDYSLAFNDEENKYLTEQSEKYGRLSLRYRVELSFHGNYDQEYISS